MTHDTAALIEELVRRWRAQGIALRPGNSPEAIGAFERRQHLVLPADVAQYFRSVDGFELENERDADSNRFLPLAEVEAESQELLHDDPASRGTLVFAEYSIWAHWYSVRVADGQVTRRGSEPIPIAPTFSDFLAKYLIQPDALLQ